MGIVKTYLAILFALLLAAPAAATPSGATDLARLFAACTGRYSAMMEHDWLMGRPGTAPQDSRALFESLLEAVQTEADLTGPDILHLRISAKHALAALLQRADLSPDAATARRALRLAQLHIGQCRAVLLG